MPAEEYRFDSPQRPPTHPVGSPEPPAATATPMDPVQLEVLWNRLLSVANEQQAALMRTAFSTIVRESQDLACAVFDSRGQMMAQSITGTPGHINPLATGVHHLLTAYPPETLEPGDVLITRRISALAVCRVSAASRSLNNLAFEIAIAACSANVWAMSPSR